MFFVPEAPYTGLLVDVRGLELQPNIAPRLLSAAGHVIHGAATVDRSLATSYGVVGYDDDIDYKTGDLILKSFANICPM